MSEASSARPRGVAIVGSTSPAGKQLRELVEVDGVGWDLQLLDTDEYAGLLQEFGGEIEIVQVISPDRLRDVEAVVFTCAPAFMDDYVRSGAYLPPLTVDATGGNRSGPVFIARHRYGGADDPAARRIHIAAGAETTVLARLLTVLDELAPVESCHATVIGSAAEHGNPLMERLQEETVEILNFQRNDETSPRLAFNVWGPGETGIYRSARISRQVGRITPPRCPAPAVQVATAPLFQGTSFSVYVRFRQEASPTQEVSSNDVVRRLGESEAFRIVDDATPLGALGSDRVLVSGVTEGAEPGSVWIWMTADGLRLTARNALELVRHAAFVGV